MQTNFYFHILILVLIPPNSHWGLCFTSLFLLITKTKFIKIYAYFHCSSTWISKFMDINIVFILTPIKSQKNPHYTVYILRCQQISQGPTPYIFLLQILKFMYSPMSWSLNINFVTHFHRIAKILIFSLFQCSYFLEANSFVSSNRTTSWSPSRRSFSVHLRCKHLNLDLVDDFLGLAPQNFFILRPKSSKSR